MKKCKSYEMKSWNIMIICINIVPNHHKYITDEGPGVYNSMMDLYRVVMNLYWMECESEILIK
jgi:hypothetical protein